MDVAVEPFAPRSRSSVASMRSVARTARPGHAGREEQPLREPRAVRVHEGARDLFGLERGAADLAAAERRAVAAGERARVRLHDAHQVRGAAPGNAHLRDADRAVPIEPRGFAQERQPPALIHGLVILYTRRVVNGQGRSAVRRLLKRRTRVHASKEGEPMSLLLLILLIVLLVGAVPGVAVQPGLGLLPERRRRTAPADPDHSASHRPALRLERRACAPNPADDAQRAWTLGLRCRFMGA